MASCFLGFACSATLCESSYIVHGHHVVVQKHRRSLTGDTLLCFGVGGASQEKTQKEMGSTVVPEWERGPRRCWACQAAAHEVGPAGVSLKVWHAGGRLGAVGSGNCIAWMVLRIVGLRIATAGRTGHVCMSIQIIDGVGACRCHGS